MPGARCARLPRVQWVAIERTRVSQVTPEIARHSPRNGFNGFLRALPGDRAFLPPSPLRSLLLKNLTPASGRQDHTTSPSAAAFRKSRSTVLVPVRRSFSEGGSASLVLRRRRVHRIPHPTSVTIAIRPSYRGRDGRKMMLIWGEINGVGLRQIGTTGKIRGGSRNYGCNIDMDCHN